MRFSFDAISTFDRSHPGRQALWERAKAYTDEIEPRKVGRWLTLLGRYGTGKTHLAKEIYQWAKRNYSGFRDPDNGDYWQREFLFLDARDMAERLRNGEWELRDRIRSAFLVVFDDLFAARDTTGFVLDQVEAALNSRVGKWTVITSNLLKREIADQDPRIASRLNRNNGQVLEITKLSDWDAGGKTA